MNRIDRFFQQGHKAFIPYVTAGLPSVDETVTILRLLVENGADIIELGYPFSDPTADGPVIQAASKHALDAGFRRADYFRVIREFREQDADTPLLVFTYMNPVHRQGCENFVAEAADAGADAFLIVDLPLEEQDEMLDLLHARDLHLIELVAPTTPPERAQRIVARGGGFIYQVARRGVTGARTELGDDLIDMVNRTKSYTDLPVALGFGVSSGEQAATVAAAADGVVVGSAIVRTIAEGGEDYADALAKLIRELANATHGQQG